MLGSPSSPAPPPPVGGNAANGKKKRRPAGTPDPDAEVVSLSPRTLLESDRYVCEICKQGFQREQNLQMHRRRHKVPWKLLKREASTDQVRKRVFVCPEPSCLHHDPCHALGDLVGIKKHFRRKHSSHRQWACAKCSKAYAVQSDYKAHLKTCGTRGHSCDCGRVFSRVESFIEHQDSCTAGRARTQLHVAVTPACFSQTASSPSPSSDANFTLAESPAAGPVLRTLINNPVVFNLGADQLPSSSRPIIHPHHHRNELQLLPAPCARPNSSSPRLLSPTTDERADDATKLQLSIGPPADEENLSKNDPRLVEQMKRAMAEKSLADEARQIARRQLELAKHEMENAKRIRQQAQVELSRAQAIRDCAVRQINATLMQVTCYACRQQFRAPAAGASEENNNYSVIVSHISSVVVTEGEEGMANNHHNHREKISKLLP